MRDVATLVENSEFLISFPIRVMPWECPHKNLMRDDPLLLLQETQLSVTNCATHLCKSNSVADLLKTRHSHMCYHAEFGRSALKGVGINTGEGRTPKFGSPGTLLS